MGSAMLQLPPFRNLTAKDYTILWLCRATILRAAGLK